MALIQVLRGALAARAISITNRAITDGCRSRRDDAFGAFATQPRECTLARSLLESQSGSWVYISSPPCRNQRGDTSYECNREGGDCEITGIRECYSVDESAQKT